MAALDLWILAAVAGYNSSSYPYDVNVAATKDFTDDTVFVAGRTAAFQVGSIGSDDLSDFEGVFTASNVKIRDILAGFGRDQTQAAIQHVGPGLARRKRFAGSRRGHSAELFGTNRYENVFFLEFIQKFVPLLGTATMPPARNTEKTGTHQHRFLCGTGGEKKRLTLI